MRCQVKWPLWPLLSVPGPLFYFVSPGPLQGPHCLGAEAGNPPLSLASTAGQWAKTNPWNPVLQGNRTGLLPAMLTFLSPLFSLCVYVCVCVDMCVCAGKPIWFFKWKEKHRRKYSEREERTKDGGPQWWSDLKRGEIISNGITHTHQLHCPRRYSTYTIQSRILLHHAVFSLCGLKPAELTKA